MSLVERLVEVSFTKASGSFSEANSNSVKLSGNRISARISKAGAPANNTLDLTVYGMTLSQMNDLATLGMVIQFVPRNTVLVQAGNAKDGLGTVFTGTIIQAWGDFQAAPDVGFRVIAQSGLAELVSTTPASSFNGPTDVVTVISGLATQAKLKFENGGVKGIKLNDPYYYGSPYDQIKACAQAAGINCTIDDGTVAIWPKDGARGQSVPLVSKDTGMVGYPSFVPYGILVKTLFNPSIVFGGKFKVESSLKPANRTWNTASVDHALDCRMPGGEWFSMITGYDPTRPQPVVQ